jgi:uncharacterized RDD family membrane protein YckC
MATRTARFCANFFDICFCFILLSPSVLFYPDSSTLATLCWTVTFIYWLVKDSWEGQSIGKRFVSIGAMSPTSYRTCNLGQSVLRNLVSLIALPIDLLLWLSPDKRRLGDRMAGTIVVREENLYRWR